MLTAVMMMMIMMKTVMLITRVVVTRAMVAMVILGIVVAQVIMIMMVMLSNPCYHSTVAIILPRRCSGHCTNTSALDSLSGILAMDDGFWLDLEAESEFGIWGKKKNSFRRWWQHVSPTTFGLPN